MKKSVTISGMPEDIISRINEFCDDNGINRSFFVMKALEEQLAQGISGFDPDLLAAMQEANKQVKQKSKTGRIKKKAKSKRMKKIKASIRDMSRNDYALKLKALYDDLNSLSEVAAIVGCSRQNVGAVLRTGAKRGLFDYGKKKEIKPDSLSQVFSHPV